MKKIRDGILIQVKIPYEIMNKIDQMGGTRTDAIRKLLANGTAFLAAEPKTKAETKGYDPAVDGYPRAKDYVGREDELKRNREIYFKS